MLISVSVINNNVIILRRKLARSWKQTGSWNIALKFEVICSNGVAIMGRRGVA